MTISVYLIMLNRDYPTAGDMLYQQIEENKDTNRIVLDMEGVSLLPSMFLNPSLGRIIREKGVDYLKSKLVFTNISVSDSRRIKEYVERFA